MSSVPLIAERRGRGRPKDEGAESAILRAADRILARSGYRAMTVDEIAAEAGVAKATIYRRWKTKASVAVDAVRTMSEFGRSLANTGSLRADLQSDLYVFVRKLRGPTGSKLRAMFSEAQNDASLAEAFREKIWRPGRTMTMAALERAIARGELRPDVDLAALSDAIYGPVYYRLLLGHGPLDKAFVDGLLDVIFGGAAAQANGLLNRG